MKHLLTCYSFCISIQQEVQDATITLLNFIYKHLEVSKNHARFLVVDLSAFNMYNLACWCRSLLSVSGWTPTLDLRLNGHFSGLIWSTGSPQGCVLSPLIKNHTIVKFANDTIIVSLLKEKEMPHGSVTDYFVRCCLLGIQCDKH